MPTLTQEPPASAASSAEYAPEYRTERVIAVCRLVIAFSSLVALALDPATPATHLGTVFTLIASYLTYSVALLLLSWRADVPSPRRQITIQVIDVASAFALVSLTDGTASPFAPYLVFPLLFASLRWRWRAVGWTGIVTVLGFTGLGLTEISFGDTGFEPNSYIVRAAFLATVSAMLAYVGAHERRARREITTLARWHGGVTDTGELLKVASAAMGARRAALAWTERDGALRVEYWTGSQVTRWEDPSRRPDSLVAPPLEGADFLCFDASAPQPLVLSVVKGALERRRLAPVTADFRARLDARGVVAVRFEGALAQGRLFLLDMAQMTSDSLLLASIVAHQIQGRLDDHCLAARLAAAAATEERVRLARNVHDGLLQSLTGIGLQLEAARRVVAAHSTEAERLLRELQDIVFAEHREVRSLVSQLRARAATPDELDLALIDTITALVLRIERQWDVRVEVETPLVFEEFEAQIPIAMVRDVNYILREALVNAARHAGGRVVAISLGIEGAEIWITVTDDGHGFAFRGHYDLRALEREGIGPKVLRERVAALGGALTIHSTPQGARLHIRLPLDVSSARPTHR